MLQIVFHLVQTILASFMHACILTIALLSHVSVAIPIPVRKSSTTPTENSHHQTIHNNDSLYPLFLLDNPNRLLTSSAFALCSAYSHKAEV